MPRRFRPAKIEVSDPARPEGLSDFAWRLMRAEERKATLKNLQLIGVLAGLMVPAFTILDYFAYPEHLKLFLALRIGCTVVICILLLLIRSELGRRYYRAFTIIMPMVPAVFISAMIFYAQDPSTTYYAGLTLCIVAMGFVFHWTYQEAFAVSVTVLVMYLVACSPAIVNGMDSREAAGFVSNCIFILAIGIVIVSGCVAHHFIRVKEFIVRESFRQQKIKLRVQKTELERTLSELRETEGQLIQSEKMVSLGQLSAGVIHEIGNPLNYSNQALFLLKKRLKGHEPDPQMQEAADDIQESLDRIKDIVTDLREFSHKSREITIDYDVEESVHVALRMLRKEIADTGTTVSLDLEPDLRVEGVKNQVTQVFVNLVHNAIQAMNGTGDDRPNKIEITSSGKDGKAKIRIRDNGPGIQEENMKQLFDPFFTTKEVGEGTGLGLSICYRIIESHSGTIQVRSEPGSFTEFTITLPLLASEAHHPVPFPPLTKAIENENAVC
ncbi:MAG: ATP-binding protein [Verrucomicrobiales bacterium]